MAIRSATNQEYTSNVQADQSVWTFPTVAQQTAAQQYLPKVGRAPTDQPIYRADARN